jgi:hypothetical protein
VLAVWSQTDVTLEYLLHIDHETSRLACIWSNILALGLWPSMMNETLKKWLQCQVSSLISLSISAHTYCSSFGIGTQNIVWPITVSAAVGTVAIIVINIYCQMIMKPSLGFEGVALSIVCMQWTNLITTVALIVTRKWWIRKFGRVTAAQTLSAAVSSSRTSTAATKYEILSSQDSETESAYDGDHLPSTTGDIELADSKLPTNIRASTKSADTGTVSEDPEDNFPAITFSVFQEWIPFLKLGIPGAASLFIGKFWLPR